ncbi:FecR family protein [Janthinobacterium fluminis]|uniref:DUF4880 domain-containing protein n=1 Tax=Janthinobacterium fluminis TaxID=2987524 RepID=A0ABT5JZV5_9BURK|nr:DUF4880 domain-containing protein [Janthinobacterium fluminis]MDC8757693.1 DUF4880 domain-containing protein [Janthinobacterium fluminis]
MKTPPRKNSHATSPSELDAQAWNWLRLLTSGDAREVDAQQFRRWVKSSPLHQAAYHDVKRRWDAIEAPARELLRVKPEAATVDACRPRLVLGGRRAFLGAAMSAAAVAGVAVAHPPLGLWPGLDEWSADDRTATGEQRALALSGGVDVMLNTRTSMRRQTDGGKLVGLDLLIGEASIDVRDGGQALTVVAGVGRSLLESGRIEVRHLNGKVCVSCIEGAVRVEHPAGARELYARQQIVYGASSLGDIASIDPKTVSAWRQGMLVFNQAPLADVVDEINRYRPGRVVLMNDAVRNKPVSGRFFTASLDLALWQLQEAFQLHARPLPAGLLLLS